MREFIISTDATCDLPKAFVEENGIAVIPMRFTLNNAEYWSEGEPTLTPKEFYDQVRKGSMPKTALITPEESAAPVSYTHLDVYKRQTYDHTKFPYFV